MRRRTIKIAVLIGSIAAAGLATVPAQAIGSGRVSTTALQGDRLLRSQLPGVHRPSAARTSAPRVGNSAAGSLSQCNTYWAPVASSTAASDTVLLATAARTPHDQWAVGFAYPDATATFSQTYAEHWDGNTWTTTPSPNNGSVSNELDGVAVFAAQDASAVGVRQTGVDASSNPIYQTIAEQWNGSVWALVPSAVINTNSNVLNAVVRTSATDGWAAGWYVNASSGVPQTLIERWNGSAWNVMSSPNLGSGSNNLLGISARAPNDVWAVGFYKSAAGSGFPRQPLIEHWDGISWTATAGPTAGISDDVLYQVSASPAGDLWAVGNQVDSRGVAQSLTERYAQGVWTVINSNNTGPGNNFLLGVAAISGNDAWAVGVYTNDNPATTTSVYQGITEHWDGGSWAIGYGLSYDRSELNAVVALSHSDVWAVGDEEPTASTPFQAITLNNCTPPTIIGIAPTSGPTSGGSAVTITGTGLIWTNGVNFGSTPASNVVIASDTQVSAVSPPGSVGVIDVRIAYFAGLSAANSSDQFTYVVLVPSAPTGVSASAGNASATVSWSPPAVDGGAAITAYVVTPYIGSTAQTAITTSGSPPSATAVISGLSNGTTYTFTVAAQNSAGTGPASAPSNAVTPITKPGAPTGVFALAGDTEATITWKPPSSNGGSAVTSYIVTAAPGGATTAVSPLAPAATLTGLTNGTTYSFTVTAVNAAGQSAAGGPSTAVTPTSVTQGNAIAVLPAMANGAYGGYVTVAYLENFQAAPAAIRVQYFDQDGHPVGKGNSAASLPFWGTWTLRQDNADALAAGQAGSAVIYSNLPLAVFVNEFAPNGAGDASSYTSIKLPSGAGSTLYAPAIANGAYGGYTTGIGLINTGTAVTDVQITYSNNTGATVKTQALKAVPAGAYLAVYSGSSGSATDANLPSGFAGTARITSVASMADGATVQPLAAIVNEVGPGGQFSSYDALASGSVTLEAPAALNNAYGGYNTGMGIQNTTSTAGTVTVTYYDSSGTPTPKTFPIPANGYLGVYQGSASDGPAPGAYTASIMSTVPVAAIVNEVAPATAGGQQSTSYNTLAGGSNAVNLPLVESAGADGWSTGLGIMNTGATATTVTITYFDASTGAFIGSTSSPAPLPPNGFWGAYQPATGLANGRRASAQVTTSTGGTVAVIANETNANSFMSYDGQ